MEQLRLGVAKVDITPPVGVPLAGYSVRLGPSEGMAHPLYLRALLFEQPVADGATRRALVVATDLIWWGPERVPALFRRIHEGWAIPEQAIILNATHSHSGPQPSEYFSPLIGTADPAYLQLLDERLLQAVEMAVGCIEPVTIERGQGTCRIGMNRRKVVDGRASGGPAPEAPIDPEVTVVRFQTQQGVTKALMAHYTCHPTTTTDTLISSEFCGVAMTSVEQELGGDAVAAYLQGCCGDVRPALVRDGDFYQGTDTEVRELGAILAREVRAILQRPLEPLAPTRLDGQTITVELPFQELPTLAALEAARAGSGPLGELSRILLAQPERLRPTMPFHITFLDIADGLSLLAMDGEVVVEYGNWVKERFGGQVLPLGYSNGMIGYVPVAHQVHEGGYEARDAAPYFGLPAAFTPELEERIKAAIAGWRSGPETGEQ